MDISVVDASSYFKGLLLLIRKDHKVTENEAVLLSRIGKRLGFEKEFCDDAIHNIIKNKYIEDAPPLFSSRNIAVMFIRDGLTLAYADGTLDYKEEKWLRSVADRNMLSRSWFAKELFSASDRKNAADHLEADKLTVIRTP